VSGATRCRYCQVFHAEAARLNGATDEEIAEARHDGRPHDVRQHVPERAGRGLRAVQAETLEIAGNLKGAADPAGLKKPEGRPGARAEAAARRERTGN